MPKYLCDLKGARDRTGFPDLGGDAVSRTLDYSTNPPTVIDVLGLTPQQLDEFFEAIKIPKPAGYNGKDGSKVPREQWFNPPASVLTYPTMPTY